jgi:gliding motility-associated-like protein
MKRCVYILILLLCCRTIQAQHTTQGKDFWVSFGSNTEQFINALTFQIRIVTVKATKVTFTFTNLGISTYVVLNAGSVYTRDLSNIEKYVVYSDQTGKSNKSLHIESDEDISVYAINLAERSTDATAVLPVNSLGVSYYHISYNPVESAHDGYTLIATEDGTNIYENNVYITKLNKGDVYSHYFEFDATGLHITTNKPVAYFATNSCVYVPKDIHACDCLYEQLFPEMAWGVSFMVPVTIRGKERVRILASKNGTRITHIGGTVVQGSLNLNAGKYVELEISKDTANKSETNYDGCYIEANNPVAVVSYLTGMEYDNLINIGDPAMTWIPSIEQSVNELLLAPFVASGSSLLDKHYVLIVTPTIDKNMTEISVGNSDYSPLSNGEWTDHVSGYSFYSMPLTVADKSYRFRNPGGITVLGYGLGYRESYYYLSGSATRKLNAAFYVNNIHHQDLNGKEFCSNEFDIKAVVKYAMHSAPGHLRWFIDGREEIAARDLLQWKKTLSEDNHTISMIVKDTGEDTDTLTVRLDVKIQKIDVNDTAICKKQTIELKVNNPSDQLTYRWYTDAAFSGFIRQGVSLVTSLLTSDTVFYVEAISSIGCSIRDSIRVKLHPVPDLQVEDINICNDLTATLQASSANAVSLKWYSDANYSDFIVQAALFETTILQQDTVFYVEALSANGCAARDSVKITVYNIPVEDLSVCYNATATVSVLANDIASLAWYSNPDYTGLIANTVSFETTQLKFDTVFYLEFVSTKGCLARDSVKITVNRLPELSVNDTSVCFGATITLTPATNAALLNWYSDAGYNDLINQAVSYTTTASANAVYYIEAFSNETCSVKDSIELSVLLPPSVKAMDDLYLCYDEEITLDVLQSDGYVSWNVSPTTFKAKSSQEYIVTASRPPCPVVRDSVTITVGDLLWISPLVLPPHSPFNNYFVQLNTNVESPNYSIIKGELPLGLYLHQTGEISGIPNNDDLWSVFTIQIEDEYNCAIAQEYVIERDFFIPKVFTPNGDGINDVFMQGYEVTIFDRTGTIIFKGDNGWNGAYQNKLVSRNIYFYKLNRKLPDGEIKVYSGYVGVQ